VKQLIISMFHSVPGVPQKNGTLRGPPEIAQQQKIPPGWGGIK
jgi:hypothetical protein